MKKTSVYLSADERRLLRQTAESENRSQADVIREAVAAYTAKRVRPVRNFALFGSGSWEGKSISEMSEGEIDELMEGFGE